MSNLRARVKQLFLILGLLLLIAAAGLITNELGVLQLDSSSNESDLKGESISAVSLPKLLVGGSDGDIYIVDQDSEAKFLGSVEDDIQDIEKAENQVFVATVRDNTESEELGESNGKVLKFDQGSRNLLFMNRLFSSPDQEADIGGQLLDIAVVGDKIVAASHDHGSTSVVDGETLYDGKISIMSREDLSVEREIELAGASDIKVYEETVLAYGVGPKAIVMDKESLTVMQELEIEGTISGVEKQGENFYFTSVREQVETGVPNPPTVRHGYVSKHSENGEEITNIDLGITSRPREVLAYGENLAILNDFSEREIKFIDFSEEEVTDLITLDDRPEHLEIVGEKAYAVGSDDEMLYVMDLESRTIEDEIKIEGINSISSY
jgi:hypothetical protein